MPVDPSKPRKRVALIVTSVLQVRFFMVPHLRALSKEHDVTLILKNDEPEILRSMNLPVRIIFVPIERQIRLGRDFVALVALIRLFLRERFDLIHTVTPKAGLLGILAATFSRLPVRVHTFQGEIWATKKGVFRWLLRTLDRLVARLATHLTVVSRSEKDFLESEGILPRGKACVLASGSIGGVDVERFRPDPEVRAAQRTLRGYGESEVVFLYVGRLNPEKGLIELAHAFSELAKHRSDVRLLIVGPDEAGMHGQLAAILDTCRGCWRFEPYTESPEYAMLSADVLMLPSHREGFGVVVIEAAASGIPSICSRIYGVTDAVIDGVTGLLFELKRTDEMVSQMRRLVVDQDFRRQLGRQAMRRVHAEFRQENVIEAFVGFYKKILFIDRR